MARHPLDYAAFAKIAEKTDWEPEFSLSFLGNNSKYMIIVLKQGVTFQRYGQPEEQTGETWYESLDALYDADTIDDICLRRDWERIESIVADFRYELFEEEDLASFLKDHGITIE